MKILNILRQCNALQSMRQTRLTTTDPFGTPTIIEFALITSEAVKKIVSIYFGIEKRLFACYLTRLLIPDKAPYSGPSAGTSLGGRASGDKLSVCPHSLSRSQPQQHQLEEKHPETCQHHSDTRRERVK